MKSVCVRFDFGERCVCVSGGYRFRGCVVCTSGRATEGLDALTETGVDISTITGVTHLDSLKSKRARRLNPGRNDEAETHINFTPSDHPPVFKRKDPTDVE